MSFDYKKAWDEKKKDVPRENGNHDRWVRTRNNKKLVLGSVEMGMTVDEACEAHTIARSTVTRWGQTDPEFRDNLAAARARARALLSEETYEDGIPGDFGGFVGKFFPDRRPHLPHQLRLVRELQSLEPREVVLFLLWPEAGKTATIEDYVCRKLALDPGHRFRVVSATDQHATRIVGFCERRMTDKNDWPEYIARFGPFFEKNQERSGRPWSQHEFTVRNSPGEERDRSVVATGWRGATTGSRIDTLIWDDVQVPENYNQSEEIFRRLRSAFFTRGKQMRILIIGHRIGPGDLYDRLHDAGLITREVILPAAGGGSGFSAEPGHPTIPQWWDQDHDLTHTGGPCCGGLVQFRQCPQNGARLTPIEYMELVRHQVGEQTWWSMYQQDPISDALTTFSGALDGCLDYDRKFGPLPISA